MRIETGINTSIRQAPVIVPGGSTPTRPLPKTLGDVAPIRLNLADLPPQIAALFDPNSKIERLKRKLNYLKNKNCRVVPARGTIACIDGQDTVYLGVDFVTEYQNDTETLAGVMAHEWGHAAARKPSQNQLDSLTWPELNAMRKEHEALADYIAGRLLALLDYNPNGLIALLRKHHKIENHKYYSMETRARLITYGFEREKELKQLAQDIFPKQVYANHYHSRLIEIV